MTDLVTTVSDERLAEMIIAAYRRGHAWCLENPGSEEYLAKAAYDYADKALSSLEALPAPVSEEMARRFIKRYREIWPGAGWPSLADATDLLNAALAAKGGQ